ncbi:hypothetical protein ACFYSH_06750 [Streptomyces sp. NPDC005791]|uniref:hypothetical protein n=1 Tax=unclassified Streptomyces TaxID=2593676 RepID=UPI003407A4AA
MNDVHELLERAVAPAGNPAVTTEAVYARAARVRFRRRAAVSAVALAVVATGAVTLPGFTDEPKTERTSMAATAPVGQADRSGKADRLAALLPPGVGSIERVSLADLTGNTTTRPTTTAHAGPLDGEYTVRKDGGVGYLVLKYLDRVTLGERLGDTGQDDLCTGDGPRLADCLREELADGSVLTTWSDSMEHAGQNDTPRWGREITGRLELKDGSLLGVRASSGYLGERSQGPLLKAPPISQEELGTLMLRPEMLPKK